MLKQYFFFYFKNLFFEYLKKNRGKYLIFTPILIFFH